MNSKAQKGKNSFQTNDLRDDRDHFSVISIGNTNLAAARLDSEGSPGAVTVLPTKAISDLTRIDDHLIEYLREPCLIACVVPAIRRGIENSFPNAAFLEAASVPPELIDFSQTGSSPGPGADRIANLAGALQKFPPPVIVLDCGTAITLEIVDRERNFQGGAIIPGRRLQRSVLAQDTGQLLEAGLDNKIPDFPRIDTEGAIKSGIDLSLGGGLYCLVEKTRRLSICRNAPLLITGGDFAFFASLLPDHQWAGPHLTLAGLAALSRTFTNKTSLG